MSTKGIENKTFMLWQRYTFYFIKNTLKIKKFKLIAPVVKKESFWAAKGLHLRGKRSPFGGQKGYI